MNDLEPILRDAHAQWEAKSLYSQRAGELFEMEDLYRACGDLPQAEYIHRLAICVGHAAYLEDRDPEVLS